MQPGLLSRGILRTHEQSLCCHFDQRSLGFQRPNSALFGRMCCQVFGQQLSEAECALLCCHDWVKSFPGPVARPSARVVAIIGSTALKGKVNSLQQWCFHDWFNGSQGRYRTRQRDVQYTRRHSAFMSGEVTYGRGPLPFQNEHCDFPTIVTIFRGSSPSTLSPSRMAGGFEAIMVYIISCEGSRGIS